MLLRNLKQFGIGSALFAVVMVVAGVAKSGSAVIIDGSRPQPSLQAPVAQARGLDSLALDTSHEAQPDLR